MKLLHVSTSLLSIVALLLTGGCRGSADGVREQVLAELRAFEAAERTLDPAAVLAFIDPEFRMFQDGERVDYAATVAQMEATLPTLRLFEPRFEDIEIIVIGPDAALSSMTFHDVITDAQGVTTRMRGPSTMLWRRRGGEWRIVFADSDHYPDYESD